MELKYLIKLYHVGSRKAKSLTIVIPSQLRKEANIDLSALFLLKLNKRTKIITVQNIKQLIEKYEDVTPVDQTELK